MCVYVCVYVYVYVYDVCVLRSIASWERFFLQTTNTKKYEQKVRQVGIETSVITCAGWKTSQNQKNSKQETNSKAKKCNN